MESLTICAPFFALPGMKKECDSVVGNQDIILRDVLKLNPLRKGEYENGPYIEGFNLDNSLDYVFYFQEVEKLVETRQYENIYILFRAIFKPYKQETQHLIVGYYSVKNTDALEIAPGAYSISGTKGHFVEYRDCLDVTDIITGFNLQDSIMKNNSENHPEYKDMIDSWFNAIDKKENKIEAFAERSKMLRALKTQKDFQNKIKNCL